MAEARQLYLARYANSKYWANFEDFSFYRLDVVDVYYVGGFGVMGWVAASEYDHSQPNHKVFEFTIRPSSRIQKYGISESQTAQEIK